MRARLLIVAGDIPCFAAIAERVNFPAAYSRRAAATLPLEFEVVLIERVFNIMFKVFNKLNTVTSGKFKKFTDC